MPNTIPPAPRRLPLALYLHPFEVVLGVVLVLVGLRTLGVGVDPPPSLEQAVGPPVSYLWNAGNIVGGALILIGVLGHQRAVPRALEKAGLILVAGASSAYAAALVTALGDVAAYSSAQIAAVAVGCVLRAVAIHKAERTVLRTLQAVNAGTIDVHPVELVRPARRATDRRP